MPQFQVSEGIQHGLRGLEPSFKTLLLDSTLVSSTATTATFESGGHRYELTGDDFVFATAQGETSLVSGTLDGMTHTLFRPGYFYAFTDLEMDIATLVAAAGQEESGTDTGALEALLYPLDWTLIGNSQANMVLANDKTADGAKASFSGDNIVHLDFGTDRFHAGAGQDQVYGGQSSDELWGGTGRDKLFGGTGADSLYGGLGRDRLLGGNGDDMLQGGRGNDTLIGGRGDDSLTGGADADRFLFNPALSAETDRIEDFEVGLDRIDIRTDARVTVTDTATGVEIDDGLRSLEVLGISSDDLDSSNFLITGL